MKAIKKGITIVITAILVLLISFNIYNFICVSVLHKDLASIGGYSVLEVVSGSMEPTIHVGDLIIIDTSVKDYKENDIVTFYDVKGSFVTHRIISIDKDEMITKGDNNNTEDEPIATKNIIGKYVFKLTGMGQILASFRNPMVLILILVIGILVCVVMSLDKDGKPIIDEEDKELEEFRKYKKQKKLEEVSIQKEEEKKTGKTSEKKKVTKSTSTFKKTESKTTRTSKNATKTNGKKAINKTSEKKTKPTPVKSKNQEKAKANTKKVANKPNSTKKKAAAPKKPTTKKPNTAKSTTKNKK